MKSLLTIYQQDFEATQGETDTSNYKTRKAARAVLSNGAGQIYLLNVQLHGYHKLPGGGIDEGEAVEEALARELMEEVGCKAEVISAIGEIIEYRDFEQLKQISYCFLAKQVGKQQQSELEENELAEDMIEVKAGTLGEAITRLQNDRPNNLEGKFIQKRDLAFLKGAQSLLPDSI
jgi:8-oxo-dGTP diphosphatase